MDEQDIDVENIIPITEIGLESAELFGPPMREMCKVICSKELIDLLGEKQIDDLDILIDDFLREVHNLYN